MYSLKLIFSTLTKSQRGTFIAISFLILIGAIFEMIGLGLIIPAIDIFLKPEDNIVIKFLLSNDLEHLSFFLTTKYLFLIIFLIYFFKNIYLAFLSWTQFKWSINISNFFSKGLFQKYLKKSFEFHKKTNSSEIFKNLEEIDMFSRALSNAVSFITEVVITSTITLFLFIIEPLIATVTISIFLILSLIFYYIFKPKLSSYGHQRQNFLKGRYRSIRESFGPGIRDIKINNREEEFITEYDNFNSNYNRVGLFASMIQETPKFLFEQLAILLIIIIIFVLAYYGKTQAEMISTLGLFVVATFKILPSIRKMLHSYQYINYGSASVRLVKKEYYSNLESDTKYNSSFETGLLKFKDKIQIKNVNFNYDDNKEIFKNINFEIIKNSTIGLIGESGSGKSTLVDIISGLVDPSAGEVLVDNNNIKNNKTDLQNIIGYVPQNIYLLDASIRENILFSKKEFKFDKSFLDEVIEKSGLGKFINSLPSGMETQIGELGAKLSGGQIQRIGIARMLFKNPEVIILDEATNALDEEIELQILKSIENLKKTKTIIIITHKKDNLFFCDKKFLIENNSISLIKN